MKIQQWQLKKVNEPKTLADVESSREKLVLCWWDDHSILPCYVSDNDLVHGVVYGGQVLLGGSPSYHKLYDQPSRPTRLEDVPDRRVIEATSELQKSTLFLWFKDGSDWWAACDEETGFSVQERLEPYSDNWQLTDHCVELVETEIGVMG